MAELTGIAALVSVVASAAVEAQERRWRWSRRGQPFFCSAGICAARAKYYPACSQTEVLEIARTKSQQIFYYALAVETLYPRVTIVPTIRTFFSLKRLVVVDT